MAPAPEANGIWAATGAGVLWSVIAMLTGIGVQNASQQQDSTLVLRPPAATCRDSAPGPTSTAWRDYPCPEFVGPTWIPTNPMPGYPPLLRDAQIENVADVLAHVDSAGRVEAVVCRDTLAPGTNHARAFRRPVFDYVRAWRFLPATSAGRPVPSTVRVVVIWTAGYCSDQGSERTLTTTVRVGTAALVAEVAACNPRLLPGVVH